eukprot:Protomagalhaensia_wolfi_Nauph_80__806@NODE_1467_length_1514_cov_233_249492_g1135_i0_p3_GENE_NODE_1467_length_1514_cov_233_249492_g1135_i0NODE_1467_length_1514_cov_233_249492_g1135_i0_p3_ORF_typecomplete_len116_score1_84_NODE_1467_length_1514_cov_233_249492_g1135_i08571204
MMIMKESQYYTWHKSKSDPGSLPKEKLQFLFNSTTTHVNCPALNTAIVQGLPSFPGIHPGLEHQYCRFLRTNTSASVFGPAPGTTALQPNPLRLQCKCRQGILNILHFSVSSKPL